MIARPTSTLTRAVRRGTESGFTLVIVLVVLVAMMLAAVSLINSASTASMVAGNMAFRQAALHAGDVGTETAIAWLQKTAATGGGTTLWEDSPAAGYHAQQLGPDPAQSQTWDDYWKGTPDLNPVKLDADASTGNTVYYVIHRLCNAKGDPTGGFTNCALAPLPTPNSGNSHDTPSVPVVISEQQYYRITSRIEGPRNTVSYVQTIVAL